MKNSAAAEVVKGHKNWETAEADALAIDSAA
jgi:hypothetical protein